LAQISTLHRECEQTLGNDWDKAPSACDKVLNYIGDVSGGAFLYDMRLFDYDYTAIRTPYEGYLSNSAKVADLYKAIHID